MSSVPCPCLLASTSAHYCSRLCKRLCHHCNSTNYQQFSPHIVYVGYVCLRGASSRYGDIRPQTKDGKAIVPLFPHHTGGRIHIATWRRNTDPLISVHFDQRGNTILNDSCSFDASLHEVNSFWKLNIAFQSKYLYGVLAAFRATCRLLDTDSVNAGIPRLGQIL